MRNEDDVTQPTWRTMEAGIELDRLIAERLGWTLESHPDRYIKYAVLDPDGKMPGAALPADTPEHAWALAFNAIEGAIPHYSTSVDAVLALLPDEINWETIRYCKFGEPWKYFVYIDDLHLEHHERHRGEAETLALAICRAWISWKDGSAANDRQP